MSEVLPPLSAISALKRHYWAGLAVFASVLGASAAYLAIAAPLYETSARLIVVDNRASVSDLGQLLTSVEPPRDVNPIATQAELVESQTVLQRALEAFREESEVSDEELPTTQEINEAVRVKIIPATSILELNYEHPNPEIAAGILNAIAESMVVENAEAIRSEASAVREFLETQIPLQQAKLQEAESTERDYRRDSSLVAPETQTQSLVNSLATLEAEERGLLAQLQEVATRNSLLQQVTAIDAPENAYTAVRVGQDVELGKLQGELTDLEIIIIDSRSRLGDRHPDLLALLEKREELRNLYTQQLSSVVAGNAPVSPESTASNELSQELMSQYITGAIERRALDSRLGAVQTELGSLRTRVTQLPALQQPLTILVREREEAEVSLSLLQSKLQEARIAEAQLAGNIQVVGYAEVPLSPVSPKAFVVLAMGAAVGTVLAIGMILILEIVDVSLHTTSEAENLLHLPVLGVLPKIPVGLKLEQFLDNPTFVEPYRSLLKNLESRTVTQQLLPKQEYSATAVTANHHFSHQDKPVALSTDRTRVIVVSSTIAGEGKSNVVLFLSAVAAMLSRKTLIIDADLRHPLQHRLLNLPPHPGLTEVTDGQSSLSDVVKPTEVENLFLLPHGQMLSRPSKISESESIRTILNNATAHYDLIILDSPPASICADAAALSQFTDGLMLVVRPNSTDRNLALQVVSELQKSNAPVMGVVMNETVSSEEKDTSAYFTRNQKSFSHHTSLSEASNKDLNRR